MFEEWIKVERNLPDHRKVVEMAGVLAIDRFSVAGRLLSIWSFFEVATDDGTLPGVTRAFLDDLARIDGFSAAMTQVGWLVESAGTLAVPEFKSWFGACKKIRKRERDKKRDQREREKAERERLDACPRGQTMGHPTGQTQGRPRGPSNSNSCITSSGFLSSSEGESEGKPDSGETTGEPFDASDGQPLPPCSSGRDYPAHMLAGIVAAYPDHRRRKGPDQIEAIRAAIDDILINGPPEAQADPPGWLAAQVRKFRPYGDAKGRYCPTSIRWFEEGLYANEASWVEVEAPKPKRRTAVDIMEGL